ncbi:MFS transporter, partial [Klebsiella pneumoniae]|uniref:MFS transporter n=1 Tax=Klebsiella pneumoniae TaxID=573 RepID=UPI001951A219
INIPYCALGGVITRYEKDRLSAQSYRFTISSLAGLMVSFATLFLVDFFGKENKQFGFQATMGIMGAIAIVMLAFCFLSTKERVAPAVEQQGSIREDLRQLL